MFKADQFNSDGYWERVDVVEWHDRALERQGGWASAPPPPMAFADDRLEGLAEEIPQLLEPYDRPWMLKDPRQCLFLPLWHEARSSADLHIVSVRHPHEIQRSLGRRNGYSPQLGVALWERYVFDMMRAIRGRQALVVSYDDLTRRPAETIGSIAEALASTVLREQPPDGRAIDDAISLVRPGREPEPPGPLGRERQDLLDTLLDQVGFCSSFSAGTIALSSESRAVIARRRRLLNLLGVARRTSAISKGRLDRLPSFR